MRNKKKKKAIEIEFRSRCSKKKFDQLSCFLSKNARDLGDDDKDVFFFIMPDRLVKIVDNISKKDAKLVLKLNRIGKGSDFEEMEIPLDQKYFGAAVDIFKSIGFTDNIMHSFQKRHNYLYKGVEIALKYSDVWGYHIELEIVVDDKSRKHKAEAIIKKIAKELGINLMSDEELAEFVKRAEEKNKTKK